MKLVNTAIIEHRSVSAIQISSYATASGMIMPGACSSTIGCCCTSCGAIKQVIRKQS